MVNAFREQDNWDNVSAGDYEQAFETKMEQVHERQREELGWFESSDYFKKLFPSLKIEKPGVDYYTPQAAIMAVIFLYIFLMFTRYSYSPQVFGYMKTQSELFSMEMAMTVLFVIIIMFIDRYVARTDTKPVVEETKLGGKRVGTGN